MRGVRISVRGLLALVTAVALYLGAREWRRQTVQKLCEQLQNEARADGYFFDVPNEWSDYVWQRKPTVGFIRRVGGSEILIRRIEPDPFAGRSPMTNQVKENKKEIDRLKSLGVVEYE